MQNRVVEYPDRVDGFPDYSLQEPSHAPENSLGFSSVISTAACGALSDKQVMIILAEVYHNIPRKPLLDDAYTHGWFFAKRENREGIDQGLSHMSLTCIALGVHNPHPGSVNADGDNALTLWR